MTDEFWRSVVSVSYYESESAELPEFYESVYKKMDKMDKVITNGVTAMFVNTNFLIFSNGIGQILKIFG